MQDVQHFTRTLTIRSYEELRKVDHRAVILRKAAYDDYSPSVVAGGHMLETQSTYLKQHITSRRARYALLLAALIIFSVQFLFPWNGDSWLRFYRSLSTCLLIVAALWTYIGEKESKLIPDEPDETEQLRNVRWTRDFVLSFIMGGGIVLLVYSLQFLLPKDSGYREALAMVGAGGLLAIASMMSGALLGFIFGIPRFLREKQTNQTQAQPSSPNGAQVVPGSTVPATSTANTPTAGQNERSQFQSNTNLEEISDWLTKIIVGLGLTKLASIPSYVKRLTWFVSHSIGEGHHEFNENVAFSLMTAFSICGFFMGYLMTRLFLQQAFDRVTADPSAGLRAAIHSAGQSEVSMDAVPSATALGSGIQSALGVQSASQGLGDAVIRSQITKLAKAYEALRLSMSSGDERTQFMEKIAAQMKSLALAAQPFVNELKRSQSSGERLAAVTALEIAPDEDSLDWLVERIDAERPFIGYHAALALLSAARAFTPPSATAPDSATQTASSVPNQPHQQVCEAIQRALKLLEEKGLRDTDRYEVLTAAKKEGVCL
jgi:hypothetical protein